MKEISGKEMCKILKNISIPVHGNKSLKKGLIKAILKQSGLKEIE